MKRFFSIEDRTTNSALIMDSEDNWHVATLVRGEGEVDETWDEFLTRVNNRLAYMNANGY